MTTRDALLRRVNLCKAKINSVQALKEEITNVIEKNCERMMDEISKVAELGPTDSSKQIRIRLQRLNAVSKLLKDHEDALDSFPLVYIDEINDRFQASIADNEKSTSSSIVSLAVDGPKFENAITSGIWPQDDVMSLFSNGHRKTSVASTADLLGNAPGFEDDEEPKSVPCNINGREKAAASATETHKESEDPKSVSAFDDLLFMKCSTATANGAVGLQNVASESVTPSTQENSVKTPPVTVSEDKNKDPASNQIKKFEKNEATRSAKPILVQNQPISSPPSEQKGLVVLNLNESISSMLHSVSPTAEGTASVAPKKPEAAQPIVVEDVCQNVRDTEEFDDEECPTTDIISSWEYLKILNATDSSCPTIKTTTLINVKSIECKVTSIEHPSLFWIKYHNSVDLSDEILAYFEDHPKEFVALENARIGDWCLAYYNDDFRRGKIMDLQKNTAGISFAKILYVDYGNIDWVTVGSLNKMPPQFYYRPMQATPCFLADVQPKKGYWTEEDVEEFTKLCREDKFTLQAIPMVKTIADIEVYPIKLHYVDKNDVNFSVRPLSSKLILSRKGTLRRTEFSRGYPLKLNENRVEPNEKPPEVIDEWRSLGETLRNKIQIELAAEEEAAAQECLAKNLHMPNLRPTPTVTVPLVTRVDRLDIESDLSGYFYFKMSHIVSPSEIYALLTDEYGNNKDMDRQLQELNEYYSVPSNRLILSDSSQQYAVCQQRKNGVVTYCRIQIRQWDRGDIGAYSSRDYRVCSQLRAYFIDYGFSTNVPSGETYALVQRFGFPTSVIRCKLDDVRPMGSNMWSDEACRQFRELCSNDIVYKGVLVSDAESAIIASRMDNDECLNIELARRHIALSSLI